MYCISSRTTLTLKRNARTYPELGFNFGLRTSTKWWRKLSILLATGTVLSLQSPSVSMTPTANPAYSNKQLVSLCGSLYSNVDNADFCRGYLIGALHSNLGSGARREVITACATSMLVEIFMDCGRRAENAKFKGNLNIFLMKSISKLCK